MILNIRILIEPLENQPLSIIALVVYFNRGGNHYALTEILVPEQQIKQCEEM